MVILKIMFLKGNGQTDLPHPSCVFDKSVLHSRLASYFVAGGHACRQWREIYAALTAHMGGIIASAAKAFSLEDEKEPEKRPVVPGEVEKSIVLARSNLIRNQKKAAINLHRLASDSDHIRYLIVQEGGVVPLINMYKAKSSEVQEYCLRALGEVIIQQY